ncbi:hypothetical protein [Paratractidigestivibacter faecalis]|uniref:hypothetical protein n=1 Tax=Paratractidigestivibacter faecalis TaxID=2292441 RepID=UPI003AB13694
MDSSTAWFDEFREWAEALAGALAAVVFVVGGVVLPGVLGEACPALFDALGLACAAGFFVGGPLWFLTRR